MTPDYQGLGIAEESLPKIVDRGDNIRSPQANSEILFKSFQVNNDGSQWETIQREVDSLKKSNTELAKGDLSVITEMLIAQATSLQTMFTCLAKRAHEQSGLAQYESIMRLALKTQSQSRTTLLALTQHLSPKHVAFVKQANIAHGPQQVNNSSIHNERDLFEKNINTQPNKLLDDKGINDERPLMDIRSKTATT